MQLSDYVRIQCAQNGVALYSLCMVDGVEKQKKKKEEKRKKRKNRHEYNPAFQIRIFMTVAVG